MFGMSKNCPKKELLRYASKQGVGKILTAAATELLILFYTEQRLHRTFESKARVQTRGQCLKCLQIVQKGVPCGKYVQDTGMGKFFHPTGIYITSAAAELLILFYKEQETTKKSYCPKNNILLQSDLNAP